MVSMILTKIPYSDVHFQFMDCIGDDPELFVEIIYSSLSEGNRLKLHTSIRRAGLGGQKSVGSTEKESLRSAIRNLYFSLEGLTERISNPAINSEESGEEIKRYERLCSIYVNPMDRENLNFGIQNPKDILEGDNQGRFLWYLLRAGIPGLAPLDIYRLLSGEVNFSFRWRKEDNPAKSIETRYLERIGELEERLLEAEEKGISAEKRVAELRRQLGNYGRKMDSKKREVYRLRGVIEQGKGERRMLLDRIESLKGQGIFVNGIVLEDVEKIIRLTQALNEKEVFVLGGMKRYANMGGCLEFFRKFGAQVEHFQVDTNVGREQLISPLGRCDIVFIIAKHMTPTMKGAMDRGIKERGVNPKIILYRHRGLKNSLIYSVVYNSLCGD